MSGNNTIQGINWRSKVSHILLLTAACSALMAGGWCKPHEVRAVAITSCTACHGNPPVDGTRAGATGAFLGSHNKHAGTGAGQSALACSVCHVQPAAGNYKHADGFINITGSALKGNSYLGGKRKPVANVPAFYGCTNVYCHSTVQAVNGTSAGVVDTTPAWGSTGPIGCATNCHKNEPATNNHNQHLSTNTAYGYSCATCHAPQTAATHANGTITMVLAGTNAAYKIAGTPYAAVPPATSLAFGSCSTNVCHGQASPAWGTVGNASKCLKCHGVRAGVFATISSANVAPGGTGTDTGGVTGTTVRGGNHQAHLNAATGISDKIHCGECHVAVNNTVAAIATHLNYTTATTTFGPLAKSQSHTPSVSRVSGAIICNNTYCHTGKTNTGANMAPVWNATGYLSGSMTMTDCKQCHNMPPNPGVAGAHSTVPAALTAFPVNTTCNCHANLSTTGTTYANIFVNKLLHLNGTIEGGDCIGCHNVASLSSPVALSLGGPAARANVVAEHKNTWSHKRSSAAGVPANTVITIADCIVCHMEGDKATQDKSAVHGDGYIDLRDPDSGLHIKNVTWNGATPGAYVEGTTDLRFVQFRRDLATRLELDPNWLTIAAIQQNHCLKCHDANGASNANAQVATGGIPMRPFGVAIIGQVAPFNSNGSGNVVNVAASLATSNASYHPVIGKQNNSYVQGAQMIAPWNGVVKTTGNNTSFGALMSCWDCHATVAQTGVMTRTVTAHGGAVTLRGPIRAAGTTAATNLCVNCHATKYATTGAQHGAGSAFTVGKSNMNSSTFSNCSYCHGYGVVAATYSATSVGRPLRAEEGHGFNDRVAGTVGSKFTGGNRPYAFIRNTLSNWSPKSATGDTIANPSTCTGTGGTCNNNMNNSTTGLGGVY